MSRLNDRIRTRLQNMMLKQFQIVVGDANGADKAMQSYLADQNYLSVIVYCSAGKCRNNVGGWPIRSIEVAPNLSGRAFYTVKDKAMAADAEYGFILWDGKSKGSLANAQTLLQAGKKVAIYHSPTRRFLHLKVPSDLTPWVPVEASEKSKSTPPTHRDSQTTLPL